MRNAIETQRFAFDEQKRENLLRSLKIEGKFVVGNVARFSYQKNHELLIDIFYEISKKRSDAVLLLIGRGELLEEIKRKVKNLDLEDKVYFLGVRNDVPDLLNAMDVFILPSRFEGLPVTLVEIQANGLCSFVSDAVTKEICIAGNMHYIGLNQEASVWAKAVLSSDVERENVDIAAAGYDIDTAAAEIKEKYRALKKREEESS